MPLVADLTPLPFPFRWCHGTVRTRDDGMSGSLSVQWSSEWRDKIGIVCLPQRSGANWSPATG